MLPVAEPPPDKAAEARAALLVHLGLADSPRIDEALTHASHRNELRPHEQRSCPHNQRLEFLGDAVLSLCVSELLMQRFPHANEGELSRLRAHLVRADALAEWGLDRGVGEALRVGGSVQRSNVSTVADAVEALIGAAYVDAGMDAARAVVQSVVERRAGELRLGAARDPKGELQERLQAARRPPPVYRLAEVRGPSHEPEYVVELLLDGEVVSVGRAPSKKKAEAQAASAALDGVPTGGSSR